jgi:DNA-binding NtrC family response regulator
MNILIVDNCESLRSYCSHILTEEGHKVHQCGSTEFCQKYLYNGSEIDTIIVNTHPTDVSTAEEVVYVSKSVNPDISIILISINWNSKEINELVDMGCSKLLLPFNENDLIDKVNNPTAVTLT